MAQTAAQVQAELGTMATNARILQSFMPHVSTGQQWYVEGNGDVPGRVRMVETTASDNAATQAAAILTALRA